MTSSTRAVRGYLGLGKLGCVLERDGRLLEPRAELGPKRLRAREEAEQIASGFDTVLRADDARRTRKKRQTPDRECVKELDRDFDGFTHRNFSFFDFVLACFLISDRRALLLGGLS